MALEEELRHTQKMEAVGQLAGSISHEVNNMLTPIVGLTEMTLRSLPGDSKSRPNLEMVLTASHRVEELVKRILAFSRADTEEMVEFDLSDVVAEAIPLLKATVPSTIQVDAEIGEGIGPVFGNPTAVQQILMNLATNAAYAMEPEGGHLSLALDRISKRDGSRLRRLLGAGSAVARLTVRDTGCSMSEEVRDRIFEPFFYHSGGGLGHRPSGSRWCTESSPSLTAGSTWRARRMRAPCLLSTSRLWVTLARRAGSRIAEREVRI